jgi:hypothetical protein
VVAYQVGHNLIKIDSAINTCHCSIRDEVLLGLLLPTSRHVVGSSRLTRISQKEIVGQGTMDGFTTSCHYSHSIEGDIDWLEKRSACSIGNIGSICTLLGGWSKEKQGRERWWVHQLEILARGVRKDFHIMIFGTVTTLPKILRITKMDPAKAKESASTKPRSQFSFCWLNLTKILSFISSAAF